MRCLMADSFLAGLLLPIPEDPTSFANPDTIRKQKFRCPRAEVCWSCFLKHYFHHKSDEAYSIKTGNVWAITILRS